MRKPTREGLVGLITKLNPADNRAKYTLLTDAEAAAIVKAMRRGITGTAIAKAGGMSIATVYNRLGSWMAHRCRCFDKARAEK